MRLCKILRVSENFFPPQYDFWIVLPWHHHFDHILNTESLHSCWRRTSTLPSNFFLVVFFNTLAKLKPKFSIELKRRRKETFQYQNKLSAGRRMTSTVVLALRQSFLLHLIVCFCNIYSPSISAQFQIIIKLHQTAVVTA